MPIPVLTGALVAGFILLMILIRARKTLGGMAVSGAGGFLALAAVNLTGLVTGVVLPLNVFSALVCCLLGAPGVISLLVLQLFW